MVQISKYGKRAEDILFYLYNNGEVPLTYLKNIVSSSYTYYRVIQLFEFDGIVKSRERIHNRKYILISLTDKGKAFAESLKRTEDDLSSSDSHFIFTPPSDFQDQYKHMSALTHLNVLDDHIAIRDVNFDGEGHDRVVYVYVKLNGHNILRLWCEVDNTFDCWHTRFAWSLPDVQAMIQIQYAKGNINRVQANDK